MHSSSHRQISIAGQAGTVQSLQRLQTGEAVRPKVVLSFDVETTIRPPFGSSNMLGNDPAPPTLSSTSTANP
jgi:hypothetical protein